MPPRRKGRRGLSPACRFFLKDLGGALGGVPFTGGSRFFKDACPPADSVLVQRYKASGLIPLGRTNTPEFGLSATTEPVLFGPTRNPWDTGRTPGGSSGGSAAAVAAGFVPLAHASDGGGSIRIPASCCGLFGMKTTRARNTLAPYMGESLAGCSVEHVVSRSVRDRRRRPSTPAPARRQAIPTWRRRRRPRFSTRSSASLDASRSRSPPRRSVAFRSIRIA